MAAPVSTTADRRTACYLLPFFTDGSFCCSLPPEPPVNRRLHAVFLSELRFLWPEIQI